MIHIALAGKGSSGKSTLLPFLVQHLCSVHPQLRILVVDADPHLSATRLLGVTVAQTLGQLRSTYERQLATGQGLRDETRDEFLERQMGREALVCEDGFDLLAMGYWELPGSQCTVNRVLERSLDSMMGRYDIVVVDNEAGVEHIGRYVSVAIDLLLIMATPEQEFLEVAHQIWQRCRALERRVRAPRLVLNRVYFDDQEDPTLQTVLETLRDEGLPIAAVLPEAPALRRLSRSGTSPLQLDAIDPWRAAVAKLLTQTVTPLLGS